MTEQARRKIKIAIVGYGNVGRGVHQAVYRNPDMVLAGIMSRRSDRVRKELAEMNLDVPVFDLNDAYETLKRGDGWVYCNGTRVNLRANVDVAVLCSGSKQDLFGKEERELKLNENGGLDNITLDNGHGPAFADIFNTVDSFDTHARIPDYFKVIDEIARSSGTVCVISAGWDPGVFSLERTLADSFLPGAGHYTFWGPGVSQGHSDAVRKIEGVKDARQYTLPCENAVESVRAGDNPELTTRDKHTRLVYVVAQPDASKEKIREAIVTMPNYFEDYNTQVEFISEEEMKKSHSEMPHGGFVITTGETGMKGNEIQAQTEYRCQWGSNPEATGNILIACARAAHRLGETEAGAFTMLDIPPAFYSPHSRDELLKHFM